MSTIIVEVYNAFKKAGVPEQDALKAAEALSNENTINKSDLERVEKEIVEIKGEIKLVKWMIGLVIAINVIPMLKTLLN